MKTKKFVAAGMLAAALLASAPVSEAAPVVGAATSESTAADQLRITLTKGNSDPLHPVVGTVVGVTVKLERLEGVDPFNKADIERISKMTMDEVRDLGIAETFSKVTDESGTVVFSGLPKGVYIASSAGDEDARTFEPFLVAMPFHTVDKTANPVEGVVVAKTHSGTTTPPVPPVTTVPSVPPGTTVPGTTVPGTTTPTVPGKNTPPKGDLPMTGAAVLGFVAVAAVLIGAGVLVIAAGRRKNNKES